MKAWKRNLLIAYLVCSLVVVVLFLVYGMESNASGPLKLLYVVMAAVVLAGDVVGTCAVVRSFAHDRATLHVGPDGAITIERSALESTARRALGSVPGVSLQKVVVSVVPRKGEPVIDVSVTAAPFGTDSLMATAGRIQVAAKCALEMFTDHEVRYVAVNFVEPGRRSNVEDAGEPVGVCAAAPDYVPSQYSDHRGSGDVEPGSVVPFDDEPASNQTDRAEEGDVAKTSLWGKVRTRVSDLRARHVEHDEDVVETDAVVESVSFVDDEPAEGIEAVPTDVSTIEGVDVVVDEAVRNDETDRT